MPFSHFPEKECNSRKVLRSLNAASENARTSCMACYPGLDQNCDVNLAMLCPSDETRIGAGGAHIRDPIWAGTGLGVRLLRMH